LLIKSGAEINAKNDEGKTPLDVAANEIIAKLFRRHGSKTGEELGVQ
jgi:ankyrin repeat protein